MPVVPQSKLPPDSQPWARYVDDSVSSLDRSVQKVSLDTNASLKSVNGALKRLGQQVQDLTDLVEEQAALQAQIIATQAQQAAQLTAINALAANQVTGATATNTNTSAISISSGGNYVPATVTVPAGYTRAVLSAVTSARLAGTTPVCFLQSNIAGNQGAIFPVFGETGGAVTTTASTSHAVTLSGLTPGSALTLYARVTSVSGVANAYFSNTLTAIFLK